MPELAELTVSTPCPQTPQAPRHDVTRYPTATGALLTALPGLEAIGLGELVDRASLLTRRDRKYVLNAAQAADVLSRISPDTRVLEIGEARSFRYESVYFDTPELTSYLLGARRRRRRFKIRTRTYVDSGQCFLEVKTVGAGGSTVKQRVPHPRDEHAEVGPGRDFIDTILADTPTWDGEETPLQPSLITRYWRSTLYLPATDSRVTIDSNLSWQTPDGDELDLPELVIVETKTGSTPSEMDRLLWSCGHRPMKISKYTTGLAALRPDLPATPWRRTLRRHFHLGGGTTAGVGRATDRGWGGISGERPEARHASR